MIANQIQVVDLKITHEELKSLCEAWFGDMVKLVVDLRLALIAVGGDLHADGEEMLLQAGSRQQDLWGANFYPWNDQENRIEYSALINIRPHQDNPSMEILDSTIRMKLKKIIEEKILNPHEKLV